MKYFLTEKKISEVQWILVAGEETFAIPENLRFYVAAKNSSDFHYEIFRLLCRFGSGQSQTGSSPRIGTFFFI